MPPRPHRFTELFGGQQAVDRVRNQQIPKNAVTLDYLDEAFTSENWIVSSPAARSSPFVRSPHTCKQVRIYEVKKEDNLGRDHRTAAAFAQGKKRKRTKPPVRRRAVAAAA
jgi:dolichyl-diphosphooligosaccharide--protein glycosyltransferase